MSVCSQPHSPEEYQISENTCVCTVGVRGFKHQENANVSFFVLLTNVSYYYLRGHFDMSQ